MATVRGSSAPARSAPAPRSAQAPARGAAAPARGAQRTAPAGGDKDGAAILAKALRTAAGKWNKAKEESLKDNFGGTTVSGDNSPYNCKLTSINPRTTDEGPKVVYDFVVVEGEETGEKVQIWHDFTDEGFSHHVRTLRRLGVPVDEYAPEDLPAALPDEIQRLLEEQPGVRITTKISTSKKNGRDYVNSYVDKLIDIGDADGSNTVAETGGEGDPPEETAPATTARGRRGAAPPPDEPPAEGEGEGEEQEGDVLEAGMEVTWMKGRTKQTGVVKDASQDPVLVRNDATKKTEEVEAAKLEILAT